eukprot:1739286-Amphidinium_carterae.2
MVQRMQGLASEYRLKRNFQLMAHAGAALALPMCLSRKRDKRHTTIASKCHSLDKCPGFHRDL